MDMQNRGVKSAINSKNM